MSRVNINDASKQDLIEKLGLSETVAARVVRARDGAPFTCLQDLEDNVEGLGPATAEKIAQLVEFGEMSGERILPEDGDGSIQFFGQYYTNDDFSELKPDLYELVEKYKDLAPVVPSDTYRGPADKDIERAVALALHRLPKYLEVAKRPQVTPDELRDVERIVTAYLHQLATAPVLNIQEIIESTNMAKIQIEHTPTNFFATVEGKVDLNVKYSRKCDCRPPDEEAGRMLYFAADLTIEIFGLILGLIGLGGAVKEAARKPLLTAFGKLLKKRRFREAWLALLEGLKAKNPKAIVDFLDALEAMGNLSEFLMHIFSGLGAWDYIITIAKFLAWLAAAAASGFVAFIAKLFNVFLDIAGIFVKINHLDLATEQDAALQLEGT